LFLEDTAVAQTSRQLSVLVHYRGRGRRRRTRNFIPLQRSFHVSPETSNLERNRTSEQINSLPANPEMYEQ